MKLIFVWNCEFQFFHQCLKHFLFTWTEPLYFEVIQFWAIRRKVRKLQSSPLSLIGLDIQTWQSLNTGSCPLWRFQSIVFDLSKTMQQSNERFFYCRRNLDSPNANFLYSIISFCTVIGMASSIEVVFGKFIPVDDYVKKIVTEFVLKSESPQYKKGKTFSFHDISGYSKTNFSMINRFS